MSRRASRPLRPACIALWVIAACLLLRVVIPAGYMPAARTSGHAVAITVCSGNGPLLLLTSVSTQHSRSDSHQTASDICAFGLYAAQALIGHFPTAQPAASTAYATLRFHEAAIPLPLDARGPPLGARAPPLA